MIGNTYNRLAPHPDIPEVDRQREIADPTDLARVIEHARKGWTIRGDEAILMALKRIEEALARIEHASR